MTILHSYNQDRVEWTASAEIITERNTGLALPWVLVVTNENGSMVVWCAAIQLNGKLTRNETMHYIGVANMDAARAWAIKSRYTLLAQEA